ncbi:tetratricopeptide repeat protein [Helicobacter pylori]|uniref:tetratricopeptide repeat protein n=1 Tax=Helicobacter pylori TaxID=210 RepID=UPI001F102964|nr:tetratricopeptide repeat protein [Helicobacter pylori]MCH4601365.1 sel1 repeat family protein [Helicobacter pylori]MCH4607843.1 sel1 repeat family protein [Helicobacter pylori]
MLVLCVYWGGVNGQPNPEELFNLGMLSYDKQDFFKAKGYFEKACDLNNGGGCSFLGDLHRSGDGVKQDSKKAAQFYSKGCELNNSMGCSFLGMLYEYGQGVEKNLTKAAQFYSKACKLGLQKACEILKELK